MKQMGRKKTEDAKDLKKTPNLKGHVLIFKFHDDYFCFSLMQL